MLYEDCLKLSRTRVSEQQCCMEIAQILAVTRFGAKTPNMLYGVCSWQLGDISHDRIPLRPRLLSPFPHVQGEIRPPKRRISS